MRILLTYFFFVTTLFSCVKQTRQNKEYINDTKESLNYYRNCFNNIDTTILNQFISCSSGIYVLINNKYVLHISLDLNIQYDSCFVINVNESNSTCRSELLIFENNNANLINYCTDIITVNTPKPSILLKAQSGQFVVVFSDQTEFSGLQTYHTTVLIKNLIFINSKTGEKIEINNELIWKVLNQGRPG